MSKAKTKRILEEQLQLLAERSKESTADLEKLTAAMIDVFMALERVGGA